VNCITEGEGTVLVVSGGLEPSARELSIGRGAKKDQGGRNKSEAVCNRVMS
jgi:hypothetical protein